MGTTFYTVLLNKNLLIKISIYDSTRFTSSINFLILAIEQKRSIFHEVMENKMIQVFVSKNRKDDYYAGFSPPNHFIQIYFTNQQNHKNKTYSTCVLSLISSLRISKLTK